MRTANTSDVAAVAALLDAAYGPNPSFEARFRAYLALEPEGWVVVEGASALVGVGGFVSFGRCAYVGLMGVAPDAQRQGIGAAVFDELLQRCHARGCALLLLDATEAGASLYARRGFRDQGAALAYSIDPRAAAAAGGDDGAIAVTQLESGGSLEAEVASYDASGYGADRSALIGRMLGEHRGRAFVARDDRGELVGYALTQARSFGPCMARSTAAARALVRRALALPYEGDRVTWLVAGQNREAVGLAESIMGAPTRTLRHMRRGDERELRSDWRRLFAKASFAVG